MRKIVTLLAGSAVLFSAVSAWAAVDAAKLNKKKLTDLGLYLDAKEAYSLKSAHEKDVLFIDVRTRAEVAFLGMPTVADANIPLLVPGDWDKWNEKKGTFELTPNSDFLTAVDELVKSHGLNKESKIIVMCRSGHRSSKAANLLGKDGYKNVYTVVDGYEGDKAKDGAHKGERVVNGWKNAGLPWSYHLDKGKMYGEMLQ